MALSTGFLKPVPRLLCSRAATVFWPTVARPVVAAGDGLNWYPHKCLTDRRTTTTAVQSIPAPSLSQRLVDSLPSSAQPYARLMRLDKPTGFLLLVAPSYWGLAMAAPAASLPSLYHMSLFGLGALAMRGAGCTVNDLLDRKFDAQVARTKNRPIASGAVTPRAAVAFLAAELSVAAAILFQFDWHSIALGSSSLVLVGLYPLCKRVTHWPQLVLGMTFNWGVLLGWSVASNGSLCLSAVLPLYGAAIAWTLVYDTIYAHQDRVDDLSIGLKSTAIAFGDKTKLWLTGFSGSMIAGLVASGLASEQVWPFYVSVAVTAAHLAHQLAVLDIHDKDNCWRLFKRNSQIGFVLLLGIVMSTLMKESKE